jgi:hypothetical protein
MLGGMPGPRLAAEARMTADEHRARLARWLELQAKATEKPPFLDRRAEREKVECMCAFWINHHNCALQVFAREEAA